MRIPRFQFRLRTLLIGVALLGVPCLYVAHETRIVAQRKTWLAAHDYRDRGTGSDLRIYGDHDKSPPLVRRWLGDTDQEFLHVPKSDAESAAAIFPEADIWVDESPPH
jgi:hypothetical protein